MCGIAGIYVKKENHGFDLDRLASELLEGIQSRGRDATGYGVVDWDGNETVEKYAVPADTFNQFREPIEEDARIILLHTRFTTQGTEMDNENNHPVRFEDTLVTHNGIITNDTEVFHDLGLERQAQVDSEAIAASLSTLDFTDTEEVGLKLKEIEGSMAVAAVNLGSDPHALLLAKGDANPIVVLEHDKIMVWCSELRFIRDAWAKVIGTPPDAKRMNHMRTRQGYVYQPDVEPIEFTWPFAPVATNQRTGYNYGWGGEQYGIGFPATRLGGRGRSTDDVTYINGECEECGEMGSLVTWYYLHDVVLCDTCAEDQGAVNPPTPIVTVHHSKAVAKLPAPEYSRCNTCALEYTNSLMNLTYGICTFCMEKRTEDQVTSDELDQRYHEQALGCASYVNRISVAVVDFLLFDQNADEAIKQSGFLKDMWKSCDYIYGEYHEGLHNNNLDDGQKGMLERAKNWCSILTHMSEEKS